MDRFSQLYLERGAPARDSVRFRNRLGSYFEQYLPGRARACIADIERETGVKVPPLGITKFFRDAEIRDVLDAITIIYSALLAPKYVNGEFQFVTTDESEGWLLFVSRALHEENVGYQVDERGSVHYHIDEEFERNRASALAVLDAPALNGVRAAFEDAYRHLDSHDTKAAARSIFESVEIAAKLLVPSADRLTRSLCYQKLKERCLAIAGGDATEQAVLGELFNSLGQWVEAVHDYRHGQASDQRVAPSESTAVLILSAGTAYLRQLALCFVRAQGAT